MKSATSGTLWGVESSFGSDSVAELAAISGATIVNGIVGSAGLRASLIALESGNRLALANKESLVAGGPLVVAARERGGGDLIPVDSEHSAIWQCLVGEAPRSIRRLVLTASGGPFRGRSIDALAAGTPRDALAHPTWAMGPRITIDSATLMNKAFEVIEAHHLFGVDYDRIDVVVHPQSIVHSMVEFIDGVRRPSWAIPTCGNRFSTHHRTASSRDITDPSDIGDRGPCRLTLTFEVPDRAAFPCLDLGYAAGRRGGSAPAVLNAADEVAVAAFLRGRIPFPAIPEIVGGALEAVSWSPVRDLDDVIAADRAGREAARSSVTAIGESSP